jgi:16S rRNA (guanine527-N7)-methyltransferase
MKELALQARKLLGVNLSSDQLAAFEQYEQELLEWNTRLNLTSIDDPVKIRGKHFLDSLTCLLVMRETPAERIIDVGSGAGFPGLPIKIACPALQLTLVESVGKKASFCQNVVSRLRLEKVRILQDRAEVVGQDALHRQGYDWAVARAVAVLPVLAEYLLPLVKVGGVMIAMKGENAPAEAQSAEHAMRVLGGHLRKLIPVTLPGVADERYLVVVDKVSATPPNYPRRVGIPAKRPLHGA